VVCGAQFTTVPLPGFERGGTEHYDVASKLSLYLWILYRTVGYWRRGGGRTAQLGSDLRSGRADAQGHSREIEAARVFPSLAQMEKAEDISKDTTAFPDFSDVVLFGFAHFARPLFETFIWSDTSDYRQCYSPIICF